MREIATAHWGEVVNGGGERVGWELARTFNAPLFVGVRNESIEPDDVDVVDLHDGTLSGRLVDRGGLLRMLGQQAGWGTAHRLRDYDVLVSSGNECLAYVPDETQPWIHYVHHTSRYATDRLPAIEEKHRGLKGPVVRRVEYLQRWVERQMYGRYAHKPTYLVANSEPVAERIRTYWGVPDDKIRVVYPPVPTHEFSSDAAPTEDYYVTVSRLDWHKNIDEIVRAFNGLDNRYRLVIAGDGAERDELEALAGDNVDLVGYVSEERKQELLAGAKGFVFAAQAEDFGISPVEALASGTPVVTVAEGFPQYVVRDGLNGYTYDRERGVGDLRHAIRRMDKHGVDWSSEQIERFADQFGADRFRAEMRAVVDEARERKHLVPEVSFDAPKQHLRADGGAGAHE